MIVKFNVVFFNATAPTAMFFAARGYHVCPVLPSSVLDSERHAELSASPGKRYQHLPAYYSHPGGTGIRDTE